MHPLRMALGKFWAPVPWMLEAAVALEIALGDYLQAAIIAGLLVFNAALGVFQESRAHATLAALRSRLALNASVRRDGTWKTVPAAELVPGDVVKLSLGAVVAADVHLTSGGILLDQAAAAATWRVSICGRGRTARGDETAQADWHEDRAVTAVAESRRTGARTVMVTATARRSGGHCCSPGSAAPFAQHGQSRTCPPA